MRELEWGRVRNRTTRSDRFARGTGDNIARDVKSRSRPFYLHVLRRRGILEGNDIHYTERTSRKDTPSWKRLVSG